MSNVESPAGRNKKKHNYTEPGLDDDDSFERDTSVEKTSAPKIIRSKEVFPILESDDFVLLHNKFCDTCKSEDHSAQRGNLVYCQGCSTTLHRDCIGVRNFREHLVTKLSDQLFVLQCKRCIGRYRIKDSLLPSFDRCGECKAQGASCIPFRPIQEKPRKQSYETRDSTPNTDVNQDLLFNVQNVLFRCVGCRRAWHYEHLPPQDRKSRHIGSKGVREDRIKHYTGNFKCALCLANTNKLSNIVAWRPSDPAARQPDSNHLADLEFADFNEDNREYLVKFQNDSYFRVQWVPGAWVAGAFSQKRHWFAKSQPPPIMTEEEAVPEEFLRIEIVFDVEFTGNVLIGKDVEADLGRIKKVRKALVKYKGLTYDDVFWEVPPKESETERWADWKRAYNEYIIGFYTKPTKDAIKRIAKARRTQFTKLELKEQPEYVKGGTLMKYQQEGMNWLYYMWWKGKNAILADEMGLGKTIQIIAFLAVLQEEQNIWPFLIVVPHSTVPNWKREIQTWAPALRVVSYYGSDSARKLSRKYELFGTNYELKCHIVVTSYHTPISDSAILHKIPWQGLIVDEGQRLKNDSTLLYTELQRYKFNHKVLLSGTPLQNNPRELFNLLQFLEPENIDAEQLEEEFGELTSETVPRLHTLIRPFFLRRTKSQVLTHLPPMAEVIIPVSMSALQRKLYKSILSKDAELIRSILSRKDKVKPSERAKLNNLLMQLRKCVGHPFLYNEDIEEATSDPLVAHRNLVEAGSKLSLLNIMLPKLKERGHRVLIFSQFLKMLDIVEDFLSGLGLNFHRLDGSVSTLQKQKRIDEFNAPVSDYFAFLLSTRAGGVGINLATADTVIILDPDFNPHQDIQALSRAHRIGQKNKVLVFHLMTRDTVEERIMQIGKKKLSLDHLIIEKMGAGEDGEDEPVDVESILKFGAKRLFEDNNEDRVIKYDDDSVDNLLDRSKIEQTNSNDDGGDGSAENAFSFARVWDTQQGVLSDAILEDETGDDDLAVEQGYWEKAIREREEAAKRETALKEQELGRGRRRKAIEVNYVVPGEDYGENDTDAEFEDSLDSDSESDIDQHSSNDGEIPNNLPSNNHVEIPTVVNPGYVHPAPQAPILNSQKPNFPTAQTTNHSISHVPNFIIPQTHNIPNTQPQIMSISHAPNFIIPQTQNIPNTQPQIMSISHAPNFLIPQTRAPTPQATSFPVVQATNNSISHAKHFPIPQTQSFPIMQAHNIPVSRPSAFPIPQTSAVPNLQTPIFATSHMLSTANQPTDPSLMQSNHHPRPQIPPISGTGSVTEPKQVGKHNVHVPPPRAAAQVQESKSSKNTARIIQCLECGAAHSGQCPPTVENQEQCRLCGLHHPIEVDACPHLSSEKHISLMIHTMSASDESPENKDRILSFLKMRRSFLQTQNNQNQNGGSNGPSGLA